MRETGERQANLLQTQLDALLVSRLDQAQRQAQSVGESLQSSVEEGLRAAGEKSSQELQARLQEIADKAAASSSDQVQKQVEESANAAAEKSLQDLASAVAGDCRQDRRFILRPNPRAGYGLRPTAAAEKSLQSSESRLQDIADKTVASSSDHIRAQVERIGQRGGGEEPPGLANAAAGDRRQGRRFILRPNPRAGGRIGQRRGGEKPSGLGKRGCKISPTRPSLHPPTRSVRRWKNRPSRGGKNSASVPRPVARYR